MEFWRIFRLLWSKRWIILGIMAMAALVILVGATVKGQRKIFEAVAIIAPLDNEPPPANTGENNNNAPSAATTSLDIASRVSNLVMQLRSSYDLYLKTADLLRQTEADRAVTVQRILEKNGYFAESDNQIDAELKRLVTQKELKPSEVAGQRDKRRQLTRERTVTQLTNAKDKLGSFKEGGIELSVGDITDIIRQKMTFDVVAGPLDVDSNRQIVNQVRIAGRFDREAEANLYVNMLCVAFIDYYATRNAGSTNARLEETKEKLTEAKKQLEDAQMAETAFKKKAGAFLTTAQNMEAARFGDMEAQRQAAQNDYSADLAALQELQRQGNNVSSTVATTLPAGESNTVRELERKISDTKIQLNALILDGYGDEWDTVKQTRAVLKSQEAELAKARRQDTTVTVANPNRPNMDAQLGQLRAKVEADKSRLDNLNREVGGQQQRINQLPEIQKTLANLGRDTAVANQFVTDLTAQLSRYRIATIRESKSGAISILSQAHSELVGGDIAAKRPQLLLLGLILSLIIGVALVVGMDALDNSIRTRHDVEQSLKLPVLGIIPEHLPDPIRAPRVTYLSPMNPVSESYRMLRTDLLFTVKERPFQSLMVATGKPGQGATTTVSNLAITLAQAGKRVILVDTDLRYPKLHDVFGLSNTAGLTTVLYGDAPLEEVLHQTEIAGLQLLPAGPPSLNPSELLGSDQMRRLHEQLKQQADFVLFDTPSAIAFADSSLLASFIDVTVIVVRANNVPRGSEDYVLRLLAKAKANILGVVLNGMPPEQVDSVHYHEQYYPQLLAGHDTSPYTNSTAPTMPLALPESSGTASTGRPAKTPTVPLRPVVSQMASPQIPVPRPRRTLDWRVITAILVIGIGLGAVILRVAASMSVK